jgi:hypothetical protein
VKLSHLPLLQVQRDLYAVPRGIERFREYIKTMTDADTGDLALPLVAMNPMGKDHVPAPIDDYLALGAEQIAADAIEVWKAAAPPSPSSAEPVKSVLLRTREFKVCLVVSDDLKGGWTNRWAAEYGHRIENAAITKRGWLTALLWTSEPPSATRVREEVLTSVHRADYLRRHALPRTLAEMLNQEGYAMSRAGCTSPTLEGDDLAYTREVIAPHLQATDRATIVACLFGDRAAADLGYPPQGLSDRAGLALALADAQRNS